MLADEKAATAAGFLRRAVAFYRRYAAGRVHAKAGWEYATFASSKGNSRSSAGKTASHKLSPTDRSRSIRHPRKVADFQRR